MSPISFKAINKFITTDNRATLSEAIPRLIDFMRARPSFFCVRDWSSLPLASRASLFIWTLSATHRPGNKWVMRYGSVWFAVGKVAISAPWAPNYSCWTNTRVLFICVFSVYRMRWSILCRNGNLLFSGNESFPHQGFCEVSDVSTSALLSET